MHGILLVHGIGDPKPGETLHGFVNGFYDYLHVKVARSVSSDQRAHAHRWLNLDVARGSEDGETPWRATISYDEGQAPGAGGQRVQNAPEPEKFPEKFLVEEVWWAKEFPPFGLFRILLWLYLTIRGQLRANWGLFLRSLRSFLRPKFWKGTNPLTDAPSPYIMFFALLVILAFVLIVVLGLLQLFVPPARPFINRMLQSAMKAGSDFLVSGLGDVQVFCTDLFYADIIRSKFEGQLRRMDECGDIDRIYVVAHSLGCLAAYETLTRSYDPFPHNRPLRKNVTFVSVGCPLDKVSWLLKSNQDYRFAYPLPDKVTRWVNIYTKYDWVADRLVEYPKSRFKESKPPVEPANRLVTNASFLGTNFGFGITGYFTDHSSYWQNYEVSELIVREVASSERLKKSEPYPRKPVEVIKKVAPVLRKPLERMDQMVQRFGRPGDR